MSLSPLNQLIGLINPTSKVKRGKIIGITSSGIKVATDTSVIVTPYIAGYVIGKYVLVNTDNTIRHESRTQNDVKIYVV